MLEDNIKRLQEIAQKLEQGASLDESLKLYEEGCKLAKICLKDLEKAKGKITLIKKDFEAKEPKEEE